MPVFPILIAIGVVTAVGVCLCLVVVLRSSRDDEGERFRHVANLTSAWSREAPVGHPTALPTALPANKANATESVDSR